MASLPNVAALNKALLARSFKHEGIEMYPWNAILCAGIGMCTVSLLPHGSIMDAVLWTLVGGIVLSALFERRSALERFPD